MANALFAAMVLWLGAAARGTASRVVVTLMLTSLFFALGPLIPAKGRITDTDGRILYRLATEQEYRNDLLAKLTFTENVKQFLHDFGAGRTEDAAQLLPFMLRACRTPQDEKLRAIVEHLKLHLDSGEPIESCNWKLAHSIQEQTA
jgi:predicted house-cleaning noncanonical NTP pyrophosphatase (MazG superfamily)